jgi:hypothetical protein
MKHKFILLLLLLDLLPARAQVKEQSISLAVMPTMSNRFMNYKTNVSNRFKDSIRKADRWRDAIGASLMLGIRNSKTSRMYVGLQLHNFGFTRRKEDIRFLDTIHPEIGIMMDQSQTGSNYVDFNYRYIYLTVPFLVSQQISGKKMKSSTIHFIYGASLSGLLKHDIRAQFHGFSARGKKVFKLRDEESEAGLLNGNIHVGLRLENLVYGKHTFVFVQPALYAPILPANYGDQRQHLYAIGLEIGLMYRPVKDP